MMTKAEEKANLAGMIAALSEGYVRTILMDLRPEMERAIDSDFCFIPFAQRRQESEDHRLAMLEAAKEREAIKADIRELERKRATLEQGINAMRSTAEQLRLSAQHLARI